MTDYNKITKKVDILVSKNTINNFIACVFNRENIIYSHESGISERNFKKGIEHQYLNRDTKFQIGTLIKLVTAIAIMQLNEKGKIVLNKSIRKYIPEFFIKNRYSEGEITIFDLLTNRSGVPSFNYNMYLKKEEYDYRNILNHLKEQFLICPPKAMEAESDLGYALLGIIIERVSQMSYEEYVTENIFKPMDIDVKFIHDAKDYALNKNELNNTYSKLGKELFESVKCLQPSRSNALLSLNDLIKLFKLFLNEGHYQDKEILTKQSIDMMLDEPIYKGEIEGKDKNVFGLRFTSKYINKLGRVIVASGNNTYHQISAILLKDKGIWSVVASDAFNKKDYIEELCADLLGVQIEASDKVSSTTSRTSYLQCRVEDYTGFYPAKDGCALVYFGNYLALKYKKEVYKMRLRQDGYFELKANSIFNKSDKKLAYFDKNGLLSIITEKKNGYFYIEDIGYALKPTTIQREWKKALGDYRITSYDRHNPYLCKKMKLFVENGYVKMALMRKGCKRIITLGIVNSREAVALGYGAYSNETIILNLSNIRYCGMSFDKVKESYDNRTKVRVVDEEKIKKKEHKKKIDKMFDFKK